MCNYNACIYDISIRIMYYPYTFMPMMKTHLIQRIYVATYAYIYISCKQSNFLEMNNPSRAKEQVAQSIAYLVSYGPFTNLQGTSASGSLRISQNMMDSHPWRVPWIPTDVCSCQNGLSFVGIINKTWVRMLWTFSHANENKNVACAGKKTNHSSCVFG